MSTSHDDFEILCALAASGHLTNTERAELSEHARNCASCQNRLLEMRQLAINLLLAQKIRTPGKQLRKGMQERFAARAIREGVPLSPRSQGVGFSAFGMVTVLLVVLLLVTATLKDGPFRKSVVDTNVSDTLLVSAPFHNQKSSPEGIANQSLSGRLSRFPRDHRTSTAVYRTTRPGLGATQLAALQGRQFTFVPYSRNSGTRAYPLSTTIRPPEVVPSFTSSYRAPGLTLDVTSEVFRHNAPHLLAASELGGFDPFRFRFNLAFRSSPGSLDLDLYGTTLKANFKTNAFELIHNAVPEATGQERSQ